MTMAKKFANKFHKLAFKAGKTGGFWVSAGGGTANVVAAIIAKKCDVDFVSALNALNDEGSIFWQGDWYKTMYQYCDRYWGDQKRWDARTIAKAACRNGGNNE